MKKTIKKIHIVIISIITIWIIVRLIWITFFNKVTFGSVWPDIIEGRTRIILLLVGNFFICIVPLLIIIVSETFDIIDKNYTIRSIFKQFLIILALLFICYEIEKTQNTFLDFINKELESKPQNIYTAILSEIIIILLIIFGGTTFLIIVSNFLVFFSFIDIIDFNLKNIKSLFLPVINIIIFVLQLLFVPSYNSLEDIRLDILFSSVSFWIFYAIQFLLIFIGIYLLYKKYTIR